MARWARIRIYGAICLAWALIAIAATFASTIQYLQFSGKIPADASSRSVHRQTVMQRPWKTGMSASQQASLEVFKDDTVSITKLPEFTRGIAVGGASVLTIALAPILLAFGLFLLSAYYIYLARVCNSHLSHPFYEFVHILTMKSSETPNSPVRRVAEDDCGNLVSGNKDLVCQHQDLAFENQVSYASYERGDLVNFTFEPGFLALEVDNDAGEVCSVGVGGQAEQHGIQAGWVVSKVNNHPFSVNCLKAHATGGAPYTIEFTRRSSR